MWMVKGLKTNDHIKQISNNTFFQVSWKIFSLYTFFLQQEQTSYSVDICLTKSVIINQSYWYYGIGNYYSG